MNKGSKKGACSAHVETAKANALQHARREGHIPSYVNPHLTSTNRTVFEDDRIKLRKSIVPLLKRAELEYTQKTGQKCQKSFTPFREDVLKLKPGITDEQLIAFKEKAEALTGWKVLGIWLHQDEGHYHSKYIEGDVNFEINYHAHVLYDCQDHETGKAIRPKRNYFSIRQDLLAESTGMERGNRASETGIRHRKSAQERTANIEQRIEKLERKAEEFKFKAEEAGEQYKNYQLEIQKLKEESKKYNETIVEGRSKELLGAALKSFSFIPERSAPGKKKTKMLVMAIEGERTHVQIPGVSWEIAERIGKDKAKLLEAFINKVIRIPERIGKIIGIKR